MDPTNKTIYLPYFSQKTASSFTEVVTTLQGRNALLAELIRDILLGKVDELRKWLLREPSAVKKAYAYPESIAVDWLARQPAHWLNEFSFVFEEMLKGCFEDNFNAEAQSCYEKIKMVASHSGAGLSAAFLLQLLEFQYSFVIREDIEIELFLLWAKLEQRQPGRDQEEKLLKKLPAIAVKPAVAAVRLFILRQQNPMMAFKILKELDDFIYYTSKEYGKDYRPKPESESFFLQYLQQAIYYHLHNRPQTDPEYRNFYYLKRGFRSQWLQHLLNKALDNNLLSGIKECLDKVPELPERNLQNDLAIVESDRL